MSHNRFEVITADPSSTSTLLSNSSEVEAEWLRNANAKKINPMLTGQWDPFICNTLFGKGSR